MKDTPFIGLSTWLSCRIMIGQLAMALSQTGEKMSSDIRGHGSRLFD
jgi:hypothetical protein